MVDFANRHIFITGASTGIGRATADLLIQRGARVTLLARNAQRLSDAVKELGANARFAAADICDPVMLLRAFDDAERDFGPVDGLFANAGSGGTFTPLTDYRDEDFEAVLRVNLFGVFRAIRQVLPGMIERKRGSIVVTGSLASKRGMPNNAAYVASKHGVMGLARAAAIEAAPHNVRVNCVIPGFIETPMLLSLSEDHDAMRTMLGKSVPLGHIGSARELAEAVAFLLSDAASHITAQELAVDGGILGTLIPR